MRPVAPESAFTVVELVVAVAIVGIMLALGVGATGLVDSRRLAAASRGVVSDIREVQADARADRRCWRMAFDPAGERYTIEVLDGATAGPGPHCAAGAGAQWRSERTVTLPRHIDLHSTTFPSDAVILTPFGSSTAGAVLLLTPSGAARQVAVGPQGGVTTGPAPDSQFRKGDD